MKTEETKDDLKVEDGLIGTGNDPGREVNGCGQFTMYMYMEISQYIRIFCAIFLNNPPNQSVTIMKNKVHNKMVKQSR